MNSHENKPSALPFPRSRKPVLITGGAGFIGTNVAHRFLSAGQRVLLYDNLSRPGVEKNLEGLCAAHGPLVEVIVGDVRDAATLGRIAREASRVFHFAAQVAVTTSLDNPVDDFEINARGTLNLLEALRALPERPPLVYTSTNKVYGRMADVRLRTRNGRYEPEDPQLREHGFGEGRCVHFHSPYGCSKGCAEQYVLDYAKTFDMPAVVFRMSCIYGHHQYGNEDQGWVAHFLIRALEEQGIVIYGDGRQVRDVLFVDDLVEAFLLAHQKIEELAGGVFNIGGGPRHTTSLLELLESIQSLNQARPDVTFKDWRPADQLYYVSDTRKFASVTGWSPRVSVADGIRRLYQWLRETRPSARAHIVDVTHLVSRNGSATPVPRNTSRDARSKRIWKLSRPRETKLAKAV